MALVFVNVSRYLCFENLRNKLLHDEVKEKSKMQEIWRKKKSISCFYFAHLYLVTSTRLKSKKGTAVLLDFSNSLFCSAFKKKGIISTANDHIDKLQKYIIHFSPQQALVVRFH